MFKSIEHAKKAMRAADKVMNEALARYDCGMAMICQLNAAAAEQACIWNDAIDWLIANDPRAPKGFESYKVNRG